MLDKKTEEFNLSIAEIIEQLPGNIYWKDVKGILQGCNRRNREAYLGLKNLSSYTGKTLYDFFSKEQADEIMNLDREIIRTGELRIIEECGLSVKGKKTWFLSHKIPVKNKQGEILGVAGVSLDVTKARALELERRNLLESILAAMPGHVYWKDLDGNYLGCNDAQAKALGLASREDITNKKAYEGQPKEKLAELKRGDERVFKGGDAITLEESWIDETGKESIFLTKKTPLYNESNQITGILGVSFDITERKQAEAMLQLAKEQAEAANAIKTSFIENMEHDIRTPFSGIYSLVDLLAKEETDPEKKELLSEVSKCAEELLNYCNGILDFSNIESEAKPVADKNFNLRELVDSVITMQRAAATDKKLDLSIDYDSNLKPIVRGDAYRTKRILLNLVSNAIKFTKVGSVKLTVNFEKNGDRHREIIVKFIVEDTGCGIPADKNLAIYERFTKLSPSNKGLYKGLGLGLRIVKQFIEQLEGDIHLQSEVDKGSRFVVYLPFRVPLVDSLVSG